jgi:hypothetical protein
MVERVDRLMQRDRRLGEGLRLGSHVRGGDDPARCRDDVGSAQVDLGASMPRAKTLPILVLVGGVLSAVGIIVGWTKITVSYGAFLGEGVTHSTPSAIFGAGLLLIGGFFLSRRVTAPRTPADWTAPIGGILVLFSVGLEFTRTYGVEVLSPEPGPQSAEEVRAQLEALIAAGAAHFDAIWTIGLYMSLVGAIIGLVGALLAIRDRPTTVSLPAAPA